MIRRRGLISLLVALPTTALALGGLLGWARQAVPATPAPLVVPFKASGIYALREPAGWTVRLPIGAPVPAGKFAYTLKTNNHTVVRSGDLDLSSGWTNVSVTLDHPAMLYLEITPPGGKPLAYGAAVAPTGLKPVVPPPKDFDAFWKRKLADLRRVPENPVLTPGESYRPEVEFSTIRMDHVNGTGVYGHLAKPKGNGKYPAMLVLQWASPPYPLHPSWAIEPAAQGWLTLNIEPHNVLPSAPQEYYNGLPESLRNYGSTGQEDREKSAFVEMYLRGVRAADFLTKHPQWDGKTLLVTGTSMGGQQSFAVAGLHPKVTHMIVHVPAGADLNGGLHGRQNGYPFFPVDNPKVMATARYVDTVNFAPRIKATSLVSMGFIDTVTPPAGIWTAFNAIRGPKEVAPLPESPHNHLATVEQQRLYTERSGAWMAALAKGQRVPLDRSRGR